MSPRKDNTKRAFDRLEKPIWCMSLFLCIACVILIGMYYTGFRKPKGCIDAAQFECDTIDVSKNECIIYARKGTP